MIETMAWGCAAIYVGLLAFKVYGAASAAHSSGAPAKDLDLSAVTVLTPVLSGDPDLASALAHNATALSGAKLIWLVDEDDAEGQRIAASIRSAHPAASIEVVLCPPAPAGTNPKTFKLDLAFGAVDRPLFLVLDDDTRLARESLARMIAELAGAALVTGLPCYRDSGSIPARLLAQFVNNNAALTYLSMLPWLAPVSINGMCYLMRTEQFRRLGGFSPLARHLADDLAVAMKLQAAGARVHQSIACVEVHTSVSSFSRYWQQMHRWFLFATLLMRVQSVAMNGVIGVVHGFHPLLLTALAGCAIASPGVVTVGLLSVVLAVRSAALAWMQHRLTGKMRHRPVLSVISEVLQPLHLLHGALFRRIRWRSRRYFVRANDDFEPG